MAESDFMQAYIDESKRNGYILCAVTVANGDVDTLRRQLRDLCPKGDARIHMKSAGKKAPRIVDGVAALSANSTLFIVKSPKLSDRRARDRALAAAALHLEASSVARVVIESCNQDAEDKRIIRHTVGTNPSFTYHHETPANPLLWLPDVHAWAWGRGGAMRQKIQHRIEVVHL